MLASKFENLQMEENESLEELSGKLNAIANEAQTMGKTYKDKSLEETSQMLKSKKTAMDTALDTDTMDFGEVTGHLQAYEMNEKLKEEL